MAHLQPISDLLYAERATKFISAGSIHLLGDAGLGPQISGVILSGHQPVKDLVCSVYDLAATPRVPRPAEMRRASE
jgi:hypothetical protein